MKYLKKEHAGKSLSVVKIADGKTLSVHTYSLETYDSDKHEMFKNLGYNETTKQEFDEFYISVVNVINEISKL